LPKEKDEVLNSINRKYVRKTINTK